MTTAEIPPVWEFTTCPTCGKHNGIANPPAGGGNVAVSWADWCKCPKPDTFKPVREELARALNG